LRELCAVREPPLPIKLCDCESERRSVCVHPVRFRFGKARASGAVRHADAAQAECLQEERIQEEIVKYRRHTKAAAGKCSSYKKIKRPLREVRMNESRKEVSTSYGFVQVEESRVAYTSDATAQH
jgi:hypothetical protein